MSFCPRCGKPTEHQFCLECLRELHPLIRRISAVNVTLCPNCNRTYDKAAWGTRPLQEILEKHVERALSFNQGARVDGVILEQAAVEPGKQELQLTVIGSADSEGESYEEYYLVPVLIQGNRCTLCEQQANTYFTGIIQLRRPNDVVAGEIERLLGRACTDVKDVTGGIDYYVTDHRIVQRVAREVHAAFGGELTIRAQHFSYDSLASKNLYRVNACIRLPKFWKGSVIRTGTKLMLITSMGKVLKGVDLETGKPFSAPCKNEYPEFAVVETTVVTNRPTLTVLDPETYQTIAIANERAEHRALEPGSAVRVCMADDKWYAVVA